MSTTSGVWLETLLQTVRERADRFQLDKILMMQYTPYADALRALLDNMVAKIAPLEAKDKDYEVEIEWINACGLEVSEGRDCPEGCDELSSNTKKYKLDYEKNVCFHIDEHTYHSNDFGAAEAIAKGGLAAKKLLIEDFCNNYVIPLLNTYPGVNGLTNGVGTPVGNTTYISAANWSANLLSYLWRVAEWNHLSNPFGLSGANLHQAYLNATFGIDPEKVGTAFDSLKMFFDERNIDTVNSPDLITYLIDRGSYAIANKTYFSPTVEDFMVARRFSEGSALFPGLDFDVLWIYRCTGGFWELDIEYVLKAGMFQNPSACDANDTGILSFICGDVPA